MKQRPLALITGGTSGIGFAIAKALAPKYNIAIVYSQNQEKAVKALLELKNKYDQNFANELSQVQSAIETQTATQAATQTVTHAATQTVTQAQIQASTQTIKQTQTQSEPLQNIDNVIKPQFEIFQQDLRQLNELPALYEKIKKHFSVSPAILINAAGRLQDGFVQESQFIEKMSLLQEHLQASMILSHLCLKGMSASRFGRIINLSSISARFAKRGQANYAAAKAGLEGFTRTLALEVAHRGITVNAIAPGLIETPMTENFIAQIEAHESGQLRKRIPAGRLGTPEEVAALAQFLCSENASYITGTVITIDGGRSLGDPNS